MNNLKEIVLSKILGEKKLQIIYFLCEKADKNGFVFITIKEICQILDVSKPTVIATLSLLDEKGILSRVKNGLYKFNS